MKHLLLFLFIFMFLACEGDIGETPSSELVVEGWIEEGGHPTVLLSFTIPIKEEYTSFDSIGQYVIRWGKVSVSDGNQTVVLSGKYDAGYYPPFVYTSTSMIGVSGRSYTLEADFNGYHATAVTTIPKSVALDSVYSSPLGDNDTLRTVHAVFRTNVNEQRYFKLFTRSATDGQQYFSSSMGILDAATLGSTADVPVYRGMKITNHEDYDSHFVVGDTVIVKLCTLDEQSYNYWKDWSNSEEFSANPLFGVTYNPRSNILGGVGYWCGYGQSQRVIIIK